MFKVCDDEIKSVSLVVRFTSATVYYAVIGIEDVDNWIQLPLRFCQASIVEERSNKR